MKIKLAILDTDAGYLRRIVSVFNTKYADKFEVYSFTDQDAALAALPGAKIDVLLAGDNLEISREDVPKRCGFAYLVDSPDVETFNNQPTICRFQRADLIYKQILSIYSDNAGNHTGRRLSDDNCMVVAFASPCGGAGTSTLAAACAVHYAAGGSKTIYLNLETFGSADVFFQGEGQFDMSDVIYAVKTRKANLSMKLESCVKQDARTGVYFFSQPKQALDMMELTAEEIIRLITELRVVGGYEYIVIDADFQLTKDKLNVLRQAETVVLVGDGAAASNVKLDRALKSLSVREQSEDHSLMNAVVLAFNKFSSKTGEVVNSFELNVIGGAPRYENATTALLLTQLSGLAMFKSLEKDYEGGTV